MIIRYIVITSCQLFHGYLHKLELSERMITLGDAAVIKIKRDF